MGTVRTFLVFLHLSLKKWSSNDRLATKKTLVPRNGFKKDVRHIMGITQKIIRVSF